MNITGNEPINAEYFTDGYGSRFQGVLPNGETAWCNNPGGMTLYQKALLEFMSRLIERKNPDDTYNPALCAEIADDYAHAYINQLNKREGGGE